MKSITPAELEKKIRNSSEGVEPLCNGLTIVQEFLSEEHIEEFLDKVPEKGIDLWNRFKKFEETSNENFNTFQHFISSIVIKK